MVLLLLWAVLFAGCGDYNSTNVNNSRPCVEDGVCGEGEDCLWCADCCVQCSLGRGERFEYVVDGFYQPLSATEARVVGVDIDADGDVDNKWGEAEVYLEFDVVLNEIVNRWIEEGKLILLIRSFVDSSVPDRHLAVQLLYGDNDPTHDATEDNLTGSGSALVAPGADRTLHLCGALSGENPTAGPDTVVVPYPLADPATGNPVALRLEYARIRGGNMDEQGWTDVHVGGGMRKETVDQVFIPALVTRFNAEILRDPTGNLWEDVRDSIDCTCDPWTEGCEEVLNEVGECACWSENPTDGTDPVTATELRCSALMARIFEPRVDIDGDGEYDLLSVGFRVSAVPITIEN